MLTLLKMENVIETDLTTLSPEMTLGELVKLFRLQPKHFPVVETDSRILVGVVYWMKSNIVFLEL